MILEWLQLITGIAFLIAGLVLFGIEILGVFRMKYVLNRMHAAAIGDTLGISLAFIGLIILNGFHLSSLKLLLVVVFLWCSSPVASHLIARLEVATTEKTDEFLLIDGNEEDPVCKS